MATTAKKSAPKKSSGKAQKQQQETDPMLKEFFIDELKDIYWAEKKLLTAIPKMQKASTTEELKNAFADHLAVTGEQVKRLEQVFSLLGEKAVAKKCEAMEGIVKEAEGLIEDTEAGTSTRDVAMILAAQKVEHYEIATYGGLATLANTLGLDDIAGLLKQTLDEEKEADEILSGVAEESVNYAAAQEEEK